MPFDRSKYPDDWEAISRYIRFERAGGRCEWEENGTRCEARHGEPNPATGSKVILTTAHLDHNPDNCEEDNLQAMCQMHHLRYDARFHAFNAAQTRHARRRAEQEQAGQQSLFGEAG